MIYIVPWQDVVGETNLETFTKIQKSILYTERMGQSEIDVFAKMKGREDDIEMWKKKRHFMRFCGYENLPGKGAATKHHGWFKAYLKLGELKFLCTAAAEDRMVMTYGEFLDWKRASVDDALEQDYYGETQELIRDLSSFSQPSTPKVRKQRATQGFIPEVA